MQLDVTICTYNPRRAVFQLVLEALAKQTFSKDSFQVWVVDNKSSSPLSHSDLAPLQRAGIRYTLLHEPRQGQIYARDKAARLSRADWTVFVDDDTVLAPDYLALATEIAEQNPQIGCFGGKLLLPASVAVPQWVKPLLDYLGIKDHGDEVITKCANQWGPWEPPGGGAVVCRRLLEIFIRRLEEAPEVGCLGRNGDSGLFSCDDSLIMRGAHALGLSCSYQPRLTLQHHLSPHRFRFGYLVRLLYSLGRSYVILERTLGNTVQPMPTKEAWRLLRKTSLDRATFCRRAWKWGYFVESRAPQRRQGVAA